jgi:phosphate transport system protein
MLVDGLVMSFHMQRQTEKLKKMILFLGAMVEESLAGAIRSVETRDTALATSVISKDNEIDMTEVDIEEECLHTLALHQPVAHDLRFVIAVLKINNDLERIADLAVNIAEQAGFLSKQPRLQTLPIDLHGMSRKVRLMLKQSLDALVHGDSDLAQMVRETDDEVDAIHRQTYHAVESGIRADPERIESLINLLNISRQLERIADHTVNIAEDVIYMNQGLILRHQRKHSDRNGNPGSDDTTAPPTPQV